ncbi:MAG TPA: 23S rRNA (pseudouridine(1915)-N(3))-methyltransferase RlmH [Candidatus Magasanikbacteria bacterium]|nr:23S rRNA (pseudouridine(1915)-N(3))-methyltransferase RlmH [Candidatus Magasanikbacteria bacterium]
MIHITVISVGKLKEQYWKDAEKEYLKRLSVFVKLEIKELKEEKFDEKSNHETIKEKEAEKITKAIPENSHVIALDKDGRQYSSHDLSDHLQQLEQLQHYNITIVIGGPLGLSDEIKHLAKESISFSQMTFTHQMTRIILLEQIYRSCMIQKGKTYHY